MKSLPIVTEDGFTLNAHLFEPEVMVGKVLIINPAVGMKQKFYFDFARYFQSLGCHVITWDYRGCGLSKADVPIEKFNASLVDWARRDMKAVIDYAAETYPDFQKTAIGHSFGGNGLGLCPSVSKLDAIVTIAGQKAYWGLYSNMGKLMLLLTFYVLMPLMVKIYGCVPKGKLWSGESLPRNVFKDWKVMITKSRSNLLLAEKYGNYYPEVKIPIFAISIFDDWQAPSAAVDAMCRDYYPNAKCERLHITKEANGGKPLGHLNFFQDKYRETLFPIVEKWIFQL